MSTHARHLIVLGFDSTLRANEALLAAVRLHTEGKIQLHDAVFIAKDADGATRVTETTDTKPSDAALGGSFWGLLIGTLLGGPVGGLVAGAAAAGVGALAAELTDIGVPDATIADLREIVTPGTTALALQVSDVSAAAVLAELKRFAGAKLVSYELPEPAIEAVQRVLKT